MVDLANKPVIGVPGDDYFSDMHHAAHHYQEEKLACIIVHCTI